MATALFDRATNIASELEQATIADAAALELFRIRYLGSKNIIKDLFAEMKLVPNERKKNSARS